MPIKPSQLDFIGASLIDNEVLFATTDTSDNTACVLNAKGFVQISGPDAEKFMQGQLSCNVAKITETKSSLGAHCTPKGRALASFRLVKTAAQEYLFGLPENNTDTLRNSLDKYIVFSKAKLSPVDNLVAVAIYGDEATSFMKTHFDSASIAGDCVTNHHGTAICIETNRFELWLNESQLATLWPAITAQFTLGSSDTWSTANIDAGLVDIEAATCEQLVPQMFKLEEHGGISFSKGCYTGQEIIARLKYLGKQKRQLTKFNYSKGVIDIGDSVEADDGKNLGLVVSIASSSGLAVVSDQALTNTSISIKGTMIVFDHGE